MDSSDREELVLERARAGLRPSSAQREAALSRLAAALSVPSASPQPFFERGAAKSVRQSPTKVVRQFSQTALLSGVLSGVLLGFGAGYQVHSRVVTVQQHVTPRTPPIQPPRLEESAPPLPSGAPVAEVVAEPAPPPARRANVRKPAALSERDAGAAGTVEPTFYEELSYVRRAQAALRNGDGTLALGLMHSLDQVQPRGALMAERNVTRVLALCQLGRSDEAMALTKSAVRSDTTTTIYQRRLSTSCARDALSSEAE